MKRMLALLIVMSIPCCFATAGTAHGLKTVVIDAGHGGRDPGAVSRDKRTYEKNINLDVAKFLKKYINESYPEVSVILTRSEDKYLTLDERAEIANRNNADLFVSIHVNSSRSTALRGYSMHILGQSSDKNRDLFAYNMDVCMRENSVIMLEDDYSTKHQGFDPSDPESYIFMQLMQSAHLEQSLRFSQIAENCLKNGPVKHSSGIWQNPFYVLWKTSMPSVLVEIGFLSNTSELEILRNPENRQRIALCLSNAFSEYKKSFDGSFNVSDLREPDTEPSAVAEDTVPPVLYGIQISSSTVLHLPGDRCFKGLDARAYKVGALYKYIVNISADKSSVLKSVSSVKRLFPDSFIVKIENDSISIAK